MSNFGTWLFAGVGVALGTAVPSIVSSVLTWLRTAWARLVERMQPSERYNSLNLATWAVEAVGKRENPDDPVVLSVKGGSARDLEQSIRRTGFIAEPLTREQREAVQAAARDYGGTGPGYWRRYLPEWTRRELLLARLLMVSHGSERCMIYGGTTDDRNWVVVCARPRWHRGAHGWERFGVGTIRAEDPGPPGD
jgi:hypothetical protein